MSEGRPKKKDKETEGIYAALVRAGKSARLIAAQTGTPITVMKDGKLVKEFPVLSEELKSVNESESEYKHVSENENDASQEGAACDLTQAQEQAHSQAQEQAQTQAQAQAQEQAQESP